MEALVLMGMLPEGLSWECLQAIGQCLCLSVCTISVSMCVFVCCHIQYWSLVSVVYSLTPCRCPSLLLYCCCLSAHPFTLTYHTRTSISWVLMNELWTVTEVDVACYRGNSRCARSARMQRHTLTPGVCVCSLAYILSLVFPKATRPTYPQCTPATQTRVN